MSLLNNPYNKTKVWYHGSTTTIPNNAFRQMDRNFSFFASEFEDALSFAIQDVIYEYPTHSDFGYVYSVEIQADRILDASRVFDKTHNSLTDEGKALRHALSKACGEDSESDIEELFDRMHTQSYRTFEPTAHPFMWLAEEFFSCLQALGYQGWYEKELDPEFGNGLNVAIFNPKDTVRIVGNPYILSKTHKS